MDYVEIPAKYFDAKGTGIDLALMRRPRAVAALRGRIFSLPPSSRFRQRALARLFTVPFETYERGDFATVPRVLYAEDCELRQSQIAQMDLPELAIGREQIQRWIELWHEPFRDVSWRPLEFLDGGDRFFFAIEMTATGRASGAETVSPFHSSFKVENGFISRQFTSPDRGEAMAADLSA